MFTGNKNCLNLLIFRGLPAKYATVNNLQYNASSIKGIIPDPYTANTVKNRYTINDDLKSTLKTMM